MQHFAEGDQCAQLDLLNEGTKHYYVVNRFLLLVAEVAVFVGVQPLMGSRPMPVSDGEPGGNLHAEGCQGRPDQVVA